ncbi:hypothetical protein J2T19_003850 [Paenibacillus tundrae]|uniref:Uncharacterized protein n=1 Tax=Paenibacillus tundrae TaxID=528187 RepID=A0ABT9WGI2_9BACL|nr:hypothetical protein [Paenibacillus tundrae]
MVSSGPFDSCCYVVEIVQKHVNINEAPQTE